MKSLEKRSVWLKITILLLSMIPIEAVGPIMPILGEIAKSFPEASPTLIGYVLTIPSLGILIMSVVAGRMTVTMNKKKILTTGLLLYMVGGVAPFFYTQSLWFILACRLLLGFGTGMCMPLTVGFIAEFYEGKERAATMGYAIAVGAIGGIITAVVAGYVGMINWRFVFLVYLIMVVILLLGWFNIPDMPAVKADEERGPRVNAGRGMLSPNLLFLLVIAFLLTTVLIASGAAAPLFVATEGLGNTAQLGIAMGIMALFVCISSIIFGRLHNIIGMYVLPIGILIAALSGLTLGSAHNLTPIYVGLALVGFAQGSSTPCFQFGIASIVDKKFVSFALGIYLALNSLGNLAAAPVMGSILHIVQQNYRFLFFSMFGILVFLAIITAIFVYINRRAFNTAVCLPIEGLPLPDGEQFPPSGDFPSPSQMEMKK